MKITRKQLRKLISENFKGSKFTDETGRHFSVEKAVSFAEKNKDKYFIPNFPVENIKHDLKYWQGDEKRMMRADTSFPLLVIIENGCLSVADGLNRLYKAVNVEEKETIDVYIVPKEDVLEFEIE